MGRSGQWRRDDAYFPPPYLPHPLITRVLPGEESGRGRGQGREDKGGEEIGGGGESLSGGEGGDIGKERYEERERERGK